MLKKRPLSSYVLFGFILLCLAILLLVHIETRNYRIIDAVFNFGHLPLFGVVALVILWILNHRSWPVYDRRYYFIAFIITFFLGIITEVAQIFFPERYFEIKDIVLDTLGAMTFLTLSYPFAENHLKKGTRCKIVSMFVIVLAAAPIIPATIDSISMMQDFPLISSFESCLETQRWKANDAFIARSKEHASHGSYSLRTELSPGIYPGISLNYLQEDWRGYGTFSCDVFNPGEKPLRIVVRINDMNHNQEYDDRFNRAFILNPSSNTVVIDLKEVMGAPKGRRMDMGNIVNICIFSYNLDELRTLYFDNFRLD